MLLALPQKYVIEIHLHLIAQMSQLLKSMIQPCASQMGTVKTAGAEVGKGGTDLMDMSASKAVNEGHSAILAIAEMALSELGLQEENIVANLRTTKFVA